MSKIKCKALPLTPCTRQRRIAPTRSGSRHYIRMSDEWSASRPGRYLPPMKGPPSTHWIEGRFGLRAGLDREARGKILCLFRGSNPVLPVTQFVVRHYTD
jgi:hypothetical protein